MLQTYKWDMPKLNANLIHIGSAHICYQRLLYGFLHKFSRQSEGVHDLAADYINAGMVPMCWTQVTTDTHKERLCYSLQSNTDREPVCFPSVSFSRLGCSFFYAGGTQS